MWEKHTVTPQGHPWDPLAVPPHLISPLVGTECLPELSIWSLSFLPHLALQARLHPRFLSVWENLFASAFILPEPLLALQGLGSLEVTVEARQRSGASPQARISFLLSHSWRDPGGTCPSHLVFLTWRRWA